MGNPALGIRRTSCLLAFLENPERRVLFRVLLFHNMPHGSYGKDQGGQKREPYGGACDDSDKHIGEGFRNIFHVSGKAFLDSLGYGFRGHRGEIHREHFMDGNIDSAVLHLVVVKPQPGFHGFQLIPDFRKPLLQGDDRFQGVRLFQEGPDALLFHGQGFFPAFQVAVLEGHVLGGLGLVGYIAAEFHH